MSGVPEGAPCANRFSAGALRCGVSLTGSALSSVHAEPPSLKLIG